MAALGLPSPLSSSVGLLSQLRPPLPLGLTSLSPGMVSFSALPPSRHPRPLTLVDEKVGLPAALHGPAGLLPLPVHGGPRQYHLLPGRPSLGLLGHRESFCYFASCPTLASYCQGQVAGAGAGGPMNCGVFEVCCSSDRYQGAFSTNFNSFRNTAGTCGIKNTDGVVGRINQPRQEQGDAEFGEYPWQAAVLKKEGFDNVYVCAGTLIDERHVLTAAHCVQGYKTSELRIRLGEWDVNRDTEYYPYYESDVTAVFVNPGFFSGNLINDIALARIELPVDFRRNPHIGPVCLPSKVDFSGQRCWVSGWGKDSFDEAGHYQNVLKEVDVTVVPAVVCQGALQQTRLGPTYRLHPGMMCAGGEQGKDACKGDGGGPLACEGPDGRYQLAGIVSWGIGCGSSGVPGVYVNVAYYLDWIIRTIRV
nr:phenoloxidase-activating factor 2-like [Procambarus clarkii]